MADLQPYRFEPERVPNPEDSETENEEVNDHNRTISQSQFLATALKIILIPGFTLTFRLSKRQNLRCFGGLSSGEFAD